MGPTALKCIFGEWFRLDFTECLMSNMCYYYWLVKNMLHVIFKLEHILLGKDIIYRMLLYLFVYFLRKMTTDKQAILSNLKIISVLSAHGK